MRAMALVAVLLGLPAAPAFADCRQVDFGRHALDSELDPGLDIVPTCRAQAECGFVGADGVRYLAQPFKPNATPRIVRKTITGDWASAPFGLRPGDDLKTVYAKLQRAGVAGAMSRTHNGRPAISARCVVRGVDIHFDALFTPGGVLGSVTSGISTPTD